MTMWVLLVTVMYAGGGGVSTSEVRAFLKMDDCVEAKLSLEKGFEIRFPGKGQSLVYSCVHLPLPLEKGELK